MATWSGWAADFLAAASLPNTANNRKFLTDWAANATAPSCGNNPIDLTHHEPGSRDCHATGQVGVSIQRYTSHTWARTAFNTQIHAAKYGQILAALASGNPYAAGNPGVVATALGAWGSVKFANVYLGETQSPPVSGNRDTHAVAAWTDVRKTVNSHLPTTLRRIDKLNAGSLSKLAHRGRVHR